MNPSCYGWYDKNTKECKECFESGNCEFNMLHWSGQAPHLVDVKDPRDPKPDVRTPTTREEVERANKMNHKQCKECIYYQHADVVAEYIKRKSQE